MPLQGLNHNHNNHKFRPILKTKDTITRTIHLTTEILASSCTPTTIKSKACIQCIRISIV